tara:strand:+ start:8005 stop:8382 length:378 start_codon:yes stop_codon:yes gene_type:complete
MPTKKPRGKQTKKLETKKSKIKKDKYPYVVISTSKRADKKYVAVFSDKDGKGHLTIHFGAKGMSDFTKHKDEKRKTKYLARHNPSATDEDWNNPYTAGSLSRWILWNKTSFNESVKDYKKRFGLK